MMFKDNLKLLLIERHLKQADLCRMTNIQTSLMSEYISGKKSPTIGNAISIADALDVSLDALVGREERVRYSEYRNTPYINQLNDSMEGLSEKEYSFMMDVLKALKQNFQ